MTEIEPPAGPDPIAGMTADLVAAYVSKNSVPVSELPALTGTTHAALVGLSRPAAEPTAERSTPAQIRKSITPDALISFIDGKGYKTLKRHLTTNGFTPETYCSRFGLPVNYPLTAASYSEARSALAKGAGLGRKWPAEAVEPLAAVEVLPARPKHRGRGKAETAGR